MMELVTSFKRAELDARNANGISVEFNDISSSATNAFTAALAATLSRWLHVDEVAQSVQTAEKPTPVTGWMLLTARLRPRVAQESFRCLRQSKHDTDIQEAYRTLLRFLTPQFAIRITKDSNRDSAVSLLPFHEAVTIVRSLARKFSDFLIWHCEGEQRKPSKTERKIFGQLSRNSTLLLIRDGFVRRVQNQPFIEIQNLGFSSSLEPHTCVQSLAP
jgi:hypothetical protein